MNVLSLTLILKVLSLLYGPTLISIHDYWKSHSFDSMDFHVFKYFLISWSNNALWFSAGKYFTSDFRFILQCLICFIVFINRVFFFFPILHSECSISKAGFCMLILCSALLLSLVTSLSRRNGLAIIFNKSLKCSTWMLSQKWQNDPCLFPRQTIHYNGNSSLCPDQ